MPTTVESADPAPMTTSQAYAAAKAEHSVTSIEQAIDQSDNAAEASTVSDTEAGAATPTPETTEAEVPAEETAQPDELLSDEEYDKLKDDPKALRKALNKAFTEKSTKLANQRKFAEAFEANPEAAFRAMAEKLGMQITDPKAVKQAEKTETTVKVSTKILVDRLSQKLGPELGFMAQPLGEVIEDFVRELVPQLTKTEIEPLKQDAETRRNEALQSRANNIREQFFAANPEAKKFEPQIAALTGKYPPGQGVDPVEYLKGLATIAMANVTEAERVKRTLKRNNKAVASAETPDPGVSASRVKPARPKNMTTEQAYHFAKQGIVFDD